MGAGFPPVTLRKIAEIFNNSQVRSAYKQQGFIHQVFLGCVFFFGVIFYLICRSSLVLPVVVLTPLCAWRALQTNVYLIRSVSLLMAYTRCVAFLLCCPAPFFARCLVSLSLPLSHLLFRFSCLVFFADELVFKGPEEATTAVACLPACLPPSPATPSHRQRAVAFQRILVLVSISFETPLYSVWKNM